MSNTFSLVCHDLKLKVWVGQGNEDMRTFYYGQPASMRALNAFLKRTYGHNLVLVNEDEAYNILEDYEEIQEENFR